MMGPQPCVPKLCPSWRGHLQAGFFPISWARSSWRPGSAPGFGESQLPWEPGCGRAPALQPGMFLPARLACVPARPFAHTPLPCLRDLIFPLRLPGLVSIST